MANDRVSYVTVSYRQSGTDETRIYAVNQGILDELDHKGDWLGIHIVPKPTGKDLQNWLEKKGCQLDCPDAPAHVSRGPQITTKRHYRDGKLHRDDGPAVVSSHLKDGTIEQKYYRDGT